MIGPRSGDPEPARVGERVAANFTTSRTVDPVPQQELQIQDLRYAWTLGEVGWAPDLFTTPTVAPAETCTLTLTPGDATADLAAVFTRAGCWTVQVKCAATWKSGGDEYVARGVDTLAATVKPLTGLWLRSDKTAICAGGVASAVHQATVTAEVTRGGQPVVGEQVVFTLTDSDPDYPASLSDPANAHSPVGATVDVTTDAHGAATVTLTSSQLVGATAGVTASWEEEVVALGQAVTMSACAAAKTTWSSTGKTAARWRGPSTTVWQASPRHRMSPSALAADGSTRTRHRRTSL